MFFVEKFYSKIIGSFVYNEALMPFAVVKNVLVDPETGKLSAFKVSGGPDKVIIPIDILRWKEVLIVEGADSIVDSSDIVAVDRVLKSGIKIYKNNVVAKTGEYVGRVYNFTLDSDSFALKNLYVAKSFWGIFKCDKRIISSKEIVEILKDKIVIKKDKDVVHDLSEEEIPIKKFAKA